MKIVIVGGVAVGASCAARARRLNEDAEIVIVERGPYVSFANCGLPYFIGGEITERKKLLVSTPESLHSRLNLQVQVRHEVRRIDREGKFVEVENLDTGAIQKESYDHLVLACGALPILPNLPGIDLPGNFVVRDIPDVDRIDDWIRERNAKSAAVIGGGYIGLEMAEQLRHRGLKTVLIEALPQVMAPLDPEFAEPIHHELMRHGVELILGDAIEKFEAVADGTKLTTKSGQTRTADLVILGLGVRPDTKLAKDAGLAIGTRGGIVVDDHMRTSDRAIWAGGDAVEVTDWVTGETALVALAGPANRQGRMIADNICGRDSKYRGTLGTAIIRVFDLVAGCTGANEKTLKRFGRNYHVSHTHSNSHASYYPGAKMIATKLIYDPENGKVLGAQALGSDGVDKRIDVIATAIKAGFTVDDLADLELAYAPPFGSAKDPVNLAGMVAQNLRAGLVENIGAEEVTRGNYFLLDVRDRQEVEKGGIPGALHIPLPELRARLGELPRDREIVAYCASGQRSYYACRILTQKGFRCKNLSGAMKTWEVTPRQ